MANKKTDEAIQTETVREAVETESTAADTGKTENTAESASGVWCYIGPNIKGVIQTGTLYIGTRTQALDEAAQAIEKKPGIQTMIVSGEALGAARIKVRTPGNALYAAYQKLAKKN
jgi:hypothetical protein